MCAFPSDSPKTYEQQKVKLLSATDLNSFIHNKNIPNMG